MPYVAADARTTSRYPSGDTIAQAGQALNTAGLITGPVSYAVDYTCTNIGIVTWQSPAAGTRVNRGAAVSVRIGTAPRPPRECL
jgi:beta-lactam-binding protein with PASTA domain